MVDWNVLYVEDVPQSPSAGTFETTTRTVSWQHATLADALAATGRFDVIQVQTSARPSDEQLNELRAKLRSPDSSLTIFG